MDIRIKGIFLFALPHVLLADVYLNGPRGSNNKLNEQNNNRANNNRLFDSQNNNEGGHQVGDNCIPNCLNGNNYNENTNGAGEGIMQYVTGSEVYVEWYAQHGCGVDHPNTYCQVVIQYMCQSDNPGLRNGKSTNKINEDGTCPGNNNNNEDCGMHESVQYYADCKARERNNGLYTADQNMNNNNEAINTRQCNNGQRSGLECNEERDYYPYWHPTPWHDIAVFTHEPENRCEYYRQETQNVKAKNFCENPAHNNQKKCEEAGSEWKTQDAFGDPPPECLGSVAQRDNNNGNAQNGQPIYYLWQVPEHILNAQGAGAQGDEQCVMRLRYNISTADFKTDALVNKAGPLWDDKNIGADYFYVDEAMAPNPDGKKTNRISKGKGPVLPQDPQEDFMNFGQKFTLQLQMNSDQYGRTFQDRTHTFAVKKRQDVPKGARILNYNVRGRRGNINQVYPSVEYDFTPTEFAVQKGTYVHFQWTGSDANNQGNDGSGRQGTDRSNMVQMRERDGNVPFNFQNSSFFCTNGRSLMLPMTEAFWSNKCEPDSDKVKQFGFLNQAVGQCDENANANDDNNDQNCKQLNRAPAYFDGGILQMQHSGDHHFVSTRNNDFTNRSQKATITVIPRTLSPAQAFGLTFLAAFSVIALVYCCAACIAIRNPNSWLFSKRYRPRIVDILCPNIVTQGTEVRRKFFREEREKLRQDVIEMSQTKISDEPVGTSGPMKSKAKAEAKAKAKGQGKGAATDSTALERPQLPKSVRTKTEAPGCCPSLPGWLYWMLLNMCVFFIGFYMHYGLEAYDGHPAYPMAKGGGFMLDLNLSIIILPMLKSLQTAIRGRLDAVVPLDDPIDTHIFLSNWVLISAIIHIAAHVVLMLHVASSPLIQRDLLGQLAVDPNTLSLGFQIWEQALRGPRYVHITGVVLTLWFMLIFATARECIRRGKRFKIFMSIHKTWPFVYLLCLLHAPSRLWIWFFFPFFAVMADWSLSASNKTPFAPLVCAQLKKKDVLALTFELPDGFTYQAGQYITVNWDGAKGEWHPFTLTSAPEESILSVNISAPNQYDWCSALRRRLISEAPLSANLKGASDKPDPGTVVTFSKAMEMKSGTIFSRPVAVGKALADVDGNVDVLDVSEMDRDASFIDDDDLSLPPDAVVFQIQGPFGAPAQNVWQYEQILVVGAGIGITPFVAILRSMQLRAIQRNSMLGKGPKENPFSKSKATNQPQDQGLSRRKGGRGKNADATASIPTKSREQLIEDIIPIPRNVHFVWIVKSQEELSWFSDLLADAIEGPCKDCIDIQIHLTGSFELGTQSSIPFAHRTFTARPDWNPIFSSIKKLYPISDVGVFLCGSPAIGQQLDLNAKKHSSPPEMTFTYYKESF